MSKSDSKKKSSSTKHEDEVSGASSVEVKSANNWESADLGDDDRKQKFLRLMGAKVMSSLDCQSHSSASSLRIET
jgi:hypothetical protein